MGYIQIQKKQPAMNVTITGIKRLYFLRPLLYHVTSYSRKKASLKTHKFIFKLTDLQLNNDFFLKIFCFSIYHNTYKFSFQINDFLNIDLNRNQFFVST